MRSAGVAVAFAVSLASTGAWASAPDLFGFGARGLALSGTLTSTATGFESVYYNPAGLGLTRRIEVGLGYQRADYFMSIDGVEQTLGDAGALTIGLAIPIPFRGPLEDRLAIGFGFVLPQTSILVADIPAPGVPRFARLSRRFETVSIMGAAGVRIFDWLSIGAGFIALAELHGAIDVAPNDAGKIGAKVKDELLVDYAPIAGAMARFDDWSVGFVFRDESAAGYELPITASLGDRFPLPIPTLNVAGTAQFDPRELTLGASYRPIDPVLVAVEVNYELWSRYPNPVAFTAVPPGYPEQPPPDFSDVVAGRLGVEWASTVLGFAVVARGGLSFQPSPVPEQTGFHNYLDNHLFGGSLGFGLERWGFRLDAAAQLQYAIPRDDVKDPSSIQAPLPVRVTGTVHHEGVALGTTVQLGAAF